MKDLHRVSERVQEHRISLLYGHIPISFVIQFAFASALALVLADDIPEKVAFFWWLGVTCSVIVLFTPYLLYQNKEAATPKNTRQWFISCAVVCVMQALVWGVGTAYLLMSYENVNHYILLLFLVMVVGSSLIQLYPSPLLMSAFALCSITPAAVAILLIYNDLICYLHVASFVLFCGFLVYASLDLSKMVRQQAVLEQRQAQMEEHLNQAQLQLKGANLQIQELSAIDSLTQVANRRYFDDCYTMEWHRAVKDQTYLSLVFVDVDDLCAYNEQFGRQMGDQCLMNIALAIRDVLRRPADIVARYGAEEFVVLLPGTEKEGGVRVAEIIRETVLMLGIESSQESNSSCVSISAGVSSCCPSQDMPSSSLIAFAEEAMFEAKAKGKNRVVFKGVEKRA